jgi:hypothetical protein
VSCVLTAVVDQRVNIKFCVKLGKTPTETYEILQTVYGDEALSRSSKRFKDGREDLQDDPRRGRTPTSRNADTIANVREMGTRDRRLTLGMMLDELNIELTIRQILIEDSRKRNICTKFVPHSLTDEQKQRRLTSCQDFIQTCQDNPSFIDCIVTGDESCLFQYDPRRNVRACDGPQSNHQGQKSLVCKSPRPKPC